MISFRQLRQLLGIFMSEGKFTVFCILGEVSGCFSAVELTTCAVFTSHRHKPKFWESVSRALSFGIHTPLQMMVLDRIKYQLGYPEAARDMLKHKSILTAVEEYTMGTARPLEQYLNIIGMDMTSKEVSNPTRWCEDGNPPPGFEEFNHLYLTQSEKLEARKRHEEERKKKMAAQKHA